nr:uncharacterized protein LOC109147197 [Ipomoea batatas]
MMEVQETLKEGCRRSIGNDIDTVIGSDPWLLVDETPYVQTALHESVCEAPVSSLLNEQVCRASEGENNEAREWKPWMNHGSFRGPRKHLINPSSQHPFQVPQSAL